MSKKAKYKAVKDNLFRPHWYVEGDRRVICQKCTAAGARKIARALNAMEDKPKAKPFAFDWSGIDPRYKWAAMDKCKAWWVFEKKPHRCNKMCIWHPAKGGGQAKVFNRPPYPGDWRDSLQERPSK